MADAIATIGHNSGPAATPKTEAELVQELRDDITVTSAEIIARCAELAEASTRIPETIDATTATTAADFVAQLNTAINTADETRKKLKAPYWRGCQVVDGLFKDVSDPLVEAKKTINGRLTKHLQAVAAENQRLAFEEQERAQREADKAAAEAEAARLKVENAKRPGVTTIAKAEAKQEQADYANANLVRATEAAQAKPADLGGRVRGSFGKAIGLKTTWTFKDLDKNTINLEALRPYLATADLEKAVRAYINANKPSAGQDFAQIAGVTIYAETKV
jgi:hypothetical protein